MRPRRRLDVQCRLNRSRKGGSVSHGAIPGGARRKSRATFERRPRHQRLDPFVRVAKALLEPRHRFACRRETKMSGFDNARMHWPDRYLMQVFAFNREKRI